MKKTAKDTQRETIPIFFAVDDNYVPYLAVAINSLKANASPKYDYDINILIEDISESNRNFLLKMGSDNIRTNFVGVQERLKPLCNALHIRDYYSKATYYRFFIPALFPQYDKGLYLDCDIVITDDISKLYKTNLENNLVAAIPDEIMTDIEVFGRYAEKVLNIPRYEYFNAGILVMNLKEMRRVNIEKQFATLLGEKTYRVTQDQDYLNVLCHNKTIILNKKWNKTPMPDSPRHIIPKIAHYKINFKPWKYDSIPYGELFWEYAKDTPYYEMLLEEKNNYSSEKKERDRMQYKALVDLALSEIDEVSESLYENALLCVEV